MQFKGQVNYTSFFTTSIATYTSTVDFAHAHLRYIIGTIGDGGIYSSATDLLVWNRALDSRKELFERHVLTDFQPSPIYYGFGFFLKKHRGLKVQYHSGSSIGFRTGYYRVPEKKLTIVILTNRNEGECILLCENILDILLATNEMR